MNAIARRSVSTVLALAIAGSLFSSTFVSGIWLHHLTPGTDASLVVALLPLPFFLLSFGSMFWFARQCDEMQRRIQFEALAFSYPLAMVGVMGLHLVRIAGFHVRFDLDDLFMAMALLYAVGLLVAWNRYR